MPTNELLLSFRQDYARLSEAQKRAFRLAVKKFFIDLRSGRTFRGSLRVKPMQNAPGIYEMTWDGHDGRATFAYGNEHIPGEAHIIWRRIGGHEIFDRP
jgi:hypothetical protein